MQLKSINNEREFTDDEFNDLLYEEYQEEGFSTLRRLISKLSNSLKRYDIDKILSTLSNELCIPVDKLKTIFWMTIKRHKDKISIVEERKKISKSIYSTIKLTLWPVWMVFGCPTHTPLSMDPLRQEENNPRVIIRNPFIIMPNQSWNSFFK